MSRNIDLSKATIGSPTPCSIALVELIRTMERLDAEHESLRLCGRARSPTAAEERRLDALDDRRRSLEAQIRREIAEKLHIDAAILQEAVTFV